MESKTDHAQVVYVTGGSKGIGLGIAAYLLGKGYRVAVSGRDLDALQKATAAFQVGNDRLLCLRSDVRKQADEQQAVQDVLEKWGQLDILVANAGVGIFEPISTMTTEQWNQTIDTNLTGVFHSVKASLDAVKQAKGYIITIASLAGTNFFAGGAAYNASKFGLVGFSQALMLDVRQEDVKVTTIMPGSVTSYFNGHTPNAQDGWKIQPEDIGELIYDLLKMNRRSLPSKVEIRPSKPPVKA